MAITNATRLSDFAAGIGTEGAILQIDNANQRIGIGTTAPSEMLHVAGIVTAQSFYGDGSNLEGITSAGLGTAISDVDGSAGAVVYYTDDLLSVTNNLTINPPASASAAYTQYRDVKLEDNVDLIIETGDDFIPDVLDLTDEGISNPNIAGNGVYNQVYADIIKNKDGLGAPAFANGLTSVGVITATGGFSGNVTGNVTGNATGILNNSDNVTIASDESDAVSNSSIIFKTDGTEKVRIVNSASSGCVGISTGNIDPDGNKLLIRGASTIGTNKGHIMLTGDSSVVGEGPQIVFSESGPGANWAGAYIGHTRQGGGSLGDLRFGTRAAAGDANTAPTERLRISSDGAFGIGGANYGTTGQVLTSQGNTAAPQWASPSGTWVKLASGSATSGEFITVTTNLFTSTYFQYKIIFSCITTSGNPTALGINFTKDNGSTWPTFATGDYRFSADGRMGATNMSNNNASVGYFLGSDTYSHWEGEISITKPSSTATIKNANFVGSVMTNTSDYYAGTVNSSCTYRPPSNQTDAVTGIRFQRNNSGGLSSLDWSLIATAV